jgi:hypothetical protein
MAAYDNTSNQMIVKTYANEGLSLNVQFTGEAFFNATVVAKAFGKKPSHWLELSETQEYITEVSAQTALEQNQLVTTKMGSPEAGGGTWLHPDLGIPFARWLSVKFAVWADRQVKDILIGQPKIMSAAELILQQAQMLVAYEKRMEEFNGRMKRIECKQQAFEDGIRYFTVIGYVGYKGLPSVNMSQAQKLGKLAKKLSSDRGVAIDRVKDQRHGYVGSYHESILDDSYAQLLEAE